MALVQIDNIYLNQIKKAVGWPRIDNLLLDDDEIKDVIVFRCLQDYFTKFPIIKEQSTNISGEMIIDFPDEYTFGVVDCRVVDVGMLGGVGGSFWDMVASQAISNTYMTKGRTGAYGKNRYNPAGLLHQVDHQRQMIKSKQNAYTTIKSRVDYPNRKLYVYANSPGKLNIQWGKYSNDFNDVIFERKNDIIDLCTADLMLHLANSAALLTDSALEVNINVDYLKEMATSLKEAVMERWSQIPDVILLHAV